MKSNMQCKSFDIKVSALPYENHYILLGDETVSKNPGHLFLIENKRQIIVHEAKLGNHLWCVIGLVHHDDVWFDIGKTCFVSLFVRVQPDLNAEKAATLKVSHTHSNISCEIGTFEIGPSKYCNLEYGPYRFEIELSADRGSFYYGKLTLTLETEKLTDSNVISFSEKQTNPTSGNSLLEYSNQLFQNPELSDVTLKIRGKEFPAHKILLSSSSPVFKAMFLSDFRESLSNMIEIKDFEFEVIREMLKFIYTQKPPRFRDPKDKIDTISLYKAAHKYDIQYLLESCREELLSTFNIANALDVLLLADMYEDALLKEKVLDFICRNPPTVADISKYDEVVRQRPNLMQDILTCKFKLK